MPSGRTTSAAVRPCDLPEANAKKNWHNDIQLAGQHVSRKQRENERIELVIYFGKSFDTFADRQDAGAMLTLSVWAKTNGLPDCGTQAYRAAAAISAGEPVQIRTIGMVMTNDGRK
jgi:hypothetical protein